MTSAERRTVRRTVLRLLRRPRTAWLVPAALLVIMVPSAPAAYGQAQPLDMAEAVILSLAHADRRIYLAPGLEASPDMHRAGIMGRARHSAETLERVRQRFDATIAYPEEVIRCGDSARPETCSIPGDGMVFYFHMPLAPEEGVLPVRVVVIYAGRGARRELVRELWELRLARRPAVGWTVLEKRRLAPAGGAG